MYSARPTVCTVYVCLSLFVSNFLYRAGADHPEPSPTGEGATGVKGPYHGVKGAVKGVLA